MNMLPKFQSAYFTTSYTEKHTLGAKVSVDVIPDAGVRCSIYKEDKKGEPYVGFGRSERAAFVAACLSAQRELNLFPIAWHFITEEDVAEAFVGREFIGYTPFGDVTIKKTTLEVGVPPKFVVTDIPGRVLTKSYKVEYNTLEEAVAACETDLRDAIDSVKST